jgi:hypothetical protein
VPHQANVEITAPGQARARAKGLPVRYDLLMQTGKRIGGVF